MGARVDLLTVLRALAAGRRDLRLAELSGQQIRWAIENGVGPLLHHVTADDPDRESAPGWRRVLAAELTARVISGGQLAAMAEILDRCSGAAKIVLLKGIALGPALYPQPHHRPMADLDVLVAKEEVPAVEGALEALGYVRRSAEPGELPASHHHGRPFWHPGTENWVEVHWALVPAGDPLAAEPAFQAEMVAAQTVPQEFEGRTAAALSRELQLVHAASHWARGVPLPGGIVTLADAALLLGAGLDWRTLGPWLEGPSTAAHLGLLLGYLRRRGIVGLSVDPPDPALAAQNALDPGSLRILHNLIDHHVVAGAPFRLPVTEPVFRTLWLELSRPATPWRKLARVAGYLLPWRRRGVPAASP